MRRLVSRASDAAAEMMKRMIREPHLLRVRHRRLTLCATGVPRDPHLDRPLHNLGRNVPPPWRRLWPACGRR